MKEKVKWIKFNWRYYVTARISIIRNGMVCLDCGVSQTKFPIHNGIIILILRLSVLSNL